MANEEQLRILQEQGVDVLVDLERADLRNEDLQGVNLHSANLSEAEPAASPVHRTTSSAIKASPAPTFICSVPTKQS